MNQLAMNFEPVRSRRRDPETSKEAAAKVGKFAAGHYARIMAALRLGPATYVEIAERAEMERHAVARRLPEMAHLGVTKTNEKRDGRTVWRIT